MALSAYVAIEVDRGGARNEGLAAEMFAHVGNQVAKAAALRLAHD